MTLAVDVSSPGIATKTTTTAGALVSSAFTAPTNALLVVSLEYDSQTVTGNNQTITDSGGLTWTRQGRKSSDVGSTGGAGTSGGVEVWSATTVSSVSRTVTTGSGVAGADDKMMSVIAFTDSGGNAPTFGAIVAAFSASATPTVNLTTTANNSWVWAALTDWSEKGNATAGSGQAIYQEGDFTGLISGHTWKQTATTATSGTSVTMNLTAPTAEQFNMLAFEIKTPAGGAAPAAEGPRSILRHAGRGPYLGRGQFLVRPGDTSFSGLASPITITPPIGTMLWAGVVPAVQAGATIVPPVAAVTLAGVVPAVTAGATIVPPVATITLAGVAPTIQAGVTITPPVGVITWAGVAPAVQAGVTVTPPVATTTWAGVVPAVQAAATITPPKATTVWAGVAPAIQAGVTIVPPVGTFTWAGVVPSVSAGGSASISPPVATITMAGVAPTISAGVTIVPPVAHMTWAGVAPVVTAGVTITTPVGNLTWAGIAPVISAGGTLRDLTLVATPLAKRWAVTPLPGRWAVTELAHRWGTTELPERWATTPLPERWATTPEER